MLKGRGVQQAHLWTYYGEIFNSFSTLRRRPPMPNPVGLTCEFRHRHLDLHNPPFMGKNVHRTKKT